MFLYLVLLLTLLTFNNILLLNEETLILICFIVFSWLFNKYIGTELKITLNKRGEDIKNSLQNSLKELSTSLASNAKTKFIIWNLFYDFQQLVKHYLQFVYVTITWFNDRNLKITQASFLKQLQFVTRLEKQTSRLLTLILIEKLKNTVLLRSYYCMNTKSPLFLCSHKVNIRQCIHSIKYN